MNRLSDILSRVADGSLPPEEAEKMLQPYGMVSMEDAVVDTGRQTRTGFPEVVFCEGKTTDQCARIFSAIAEKNSMVLGTRAVPEQFEAVRAAAPAAVWHEKARCITIGGPAEHHGVVSICTAGTTDIPVAEEAAVTAEMCGAEVQRIYDVGVSGLHRLLSRADDLRRSNAIVAVAGMEGALASVISGLVAVPVIAVPTSVGYGANFGGLSALLAMLNSCAAGTTVVNIDNGFGGGYAAAQINWMGVSHEDTLS